MRLPRDNPLAIDFDAGEAILIADLDVLDDTTVPNALNLGPAVPTNVTFEVRWSGPINRDITVQDAANGFRGEFKENQATLELVGHAGRVRVRLGCGQYVDQRFR